MFGGHFGTLLIKGRRGGRRNEQNKTKQQNKEENAGGTKAFLHYSTPQHTAIHGNVSRAAATRVATGIAICTPC